MDSGRLALLQAEISGQLGLIDEIYARIEERQKSDSPYRAEALAYQLHNLYCALEDLFQIVARAFENEIVDRAHYHSELLKRMTLRIEGVRPALLSEDTARLLDSLPSFRHFIRHAYVYEIDPRRVALVLEDALALRQRYHDEIQAFLRSLKPDN